MIAASSTTDRIGDRLRESVWPSRETAVAGPRRPAALVTPRRLLALRVLYALNVVGAGGLGVLLLAAPEAAADLLYGGGPTAGGSRTVLACVWISLGLLSVLGLRSPLRLSPG